MQNIEFTLNQGEEYIQLIQLLKATNCVMTGGEAQQVVLEGLVKHNGEIDLRKRAKCYPGDVIDFEQIHITIKG